MISIRGMRVTSKGHPIETRMDRLDPANFPPQRNRFWEPARARDRHGVWHHNKHTRVYEIRIFGLMFWIFKVVR